MDEQTKNVDQVKNTTSELPEISNRLPLRALNSVKTLPSEVLPAIYLSKIQTKCC